MSDHIIAATINAIGAIIAAIIGLVGLYIIQHRPHKSRKSKNTENTENTEIEITRKTTVRESTAGKSMAEVLGISSDIANVITNTKTGNVEFILYKGKVYENSKCKTIVGYTLFITGIIGASLFLLFVFYLVLQL